MPALGTKGLIAQLVEQQTENLRVGGSIPPETTICRNTRVVQRRVLETRGLITCEFESHFRHHILKGADAE